MVQESQGHLAGWSRKRKDILREKKTAVTVFCGDQQLSFTSDLFEKHMFFWGLYIYIICIIDG